MERRTMDTSTLDIFSEVRATLNLPVVQRAIPELLIALTEVGSESGTNISVESKEYVLSGSWQQISAAKWSLEKRFKPTKTVCGSGLSSELSEVSRSSLDQDADISRRMPGKVFGEGEADTSSEVTAGVESSERLHASRKEYFASHEGETSVGAEAPTDCTISADKVIPVDIDIWQYIERLCGNFLDTIESDYGVSILPAECDGLLMVTISGSDSRRVSEAHWRFVELHFEILSRVVVEICQPPRKLFNSNILMAARKCVEANYRDRVLVKAERGKYVFIGEATTAKEARFQFMQLAHLPNTPRAKPDQRERGSPARPKQKKRAQHDGGESPRKTAAEPLASASQQRHKDEHVTTRDASRSTMPSQHCSEREIPIPPNNSLVTFTFQSQTSSGGESVLVQSEIVPARQPETGTQMTSGSATPLQDVDPLVDPVDRCKDVGHQPDSVKSPGRYESEGSDAPNDTASDCADSGDTVRREDAANDSDALVSASDSTRELSGSDYSGMPSLERISSGEESASDSESVEQENGGRERSNTATIDHQPEEPMRLGSVETRHGEASKKQSRDGAAMSTVVDALNDLVTSSSGDRVTSNTPVGIAGRLYAAGGTATEDEVLPSYPDASTRHDMVQDLLGKNDPRLTASLQKLVDPPEDGTAIDVLVSSFKFCSLYHEKQEHGDREGHGNSGGLSIREGHDDHENHGDTETHDSDEEHDNLGRNDDQEGHDVPEKHDDHEGHDDPEDQDEHEGHNDHAESYGDPQRHDDPKKDTTDDYNVPELKTSLDEMEERIECTVCGETYKLSFFMGEGDPTCINCATAEAEDTRAMAAARLPPHSPEVRKSSPIDTSDDDDDVPATRTLKQPVGGTMSCVLDIKSDLPGYQQVGTIIITYDFPGGIIAERESGIKMKCAAAMFNAYLANNGDGKRLYRRLEDAFKRRLLFRVQLCENPFASGKIVWADVKHKTQIKGTNGYPDQMYLVQASKQLDDLSIPAVN